MDKKAIASDRTARQIGNQKQEAGHGKKQKSFATNSTNCTKMVREIRAIRGGASRG